MNRFPEASSLASPTPAPWARILSNGKYRLLLTAEGIGYSSWGEIALTPELGDAPAGGSGSEIYINEWDIGPTEAVGGGVSLRGVDRRTERGTPGVLRMHCSYPDLTVTHEIAVAPGVGAELHRLTLLNQASRRRSLEVTTGVMVALNDPGAHRAHPVFSKLFLETEWAPAARCLLVRRRPRTPGEQFPWMFHALLSGRLSGFETDRARYWGRGSGPSDPQAPRTPGPRSGTLGPVLDPLLSLRTRVDLDAGDTARVDYVIGGASDRSDALALVQRLAAIDAVESCFVDARDHAAKALERLELSAEEGEYLEALACAVVHGRPGLRSDFEDVDRREEDVDGLTRFGLTMRTPWVVFHPAAGARSDPQTLAACRYWKALGLPLLPVVVSEQRLSSRPPEEDGYLQVRPEAMEVRALEVLDRAARLVIREHFPDFLSLTAVDANRGGAGRSEFSLAASPGKPSVKTTAGGRSFTAEITPLRFANGYGGFREDGDEYVVRVSHEDGRIQLPPRPWINVVANETFGFLISETGAGFTWKGNSREHRLTPWYNDPVLDPHGEAFYVRDEETGEFWSPFPGPCPLPTDYEVRHGLGTTTGRVAGRGLEIESIAFVPRRDPLRITILRIREQEGRPRRLSLVSYYRLVIGSSPEETVPYVVTDYDATLGLVTGRNTLGPPGERALVFAAIATVSPMSALHVTGDRQGFLGPGGDLANPAALRREAALDGRTGGGLDPCIAQQVQLEIPPGGTVQVAFFLGEGEDLSEVRTLTANYREAGAVDRALEEVRDFWMRGVSGIRITTPMEGLDLLVNAWLPYQILSCRLWARSALYQSGGAFGYRDQLQDAAALVYLWPDRTREQILLHAAHQFEEGDVLHWWHPPHSRGLRTRFADDLLWLPFVVAYYLRVTGDRSVLGTSAPFLRARALEPGEDEAYLWPERSSEVADIYEHCCRALDRSLTRGERGLPLFGTGDWNDGMNRVGREGRGESVWLGFFLYSVLEAFLPFCRERGDEARVQRYRSYREGLLASLNDAGWDGAWYRRGYYDDGSPLGSSLDDECRIDGLVQAWAVLSGAAPPERAARAMDAVEEHLVSERDGIIRLLTPPFDKTAHDPGYIRGYVPGVRENGGQYTHAALWMVEATARLRRNHRAARLLDLLNPIRHTRSREAADVYGAEPYAVAADVYGEPPHVGRAGWSWYTGSAGWMYRVALESILGFRVSGGNTIVLEPCVPDDWPEFTVEYRIPGEETAYVIHAVNPNGVARGIVEAVLDGVPLQVDVGIAEVALTHDGIRHRVDLVLGDPAEGRP